MKSASLLLVSITVLSIGYILQHEERRVLLNTNIKIPDNEINTNNIIGYLIVYTTGNNAALVAVLNKAYSEIKSAIGGEWR